MMTREDELLRMLELLGRRYKAAYILEAQPVLDELAKIQNLRPMILTKEEAARLVLFEVRCEGAGGPGALAEDEK